MSLKIEKKTSDEAQSKGEVKAWVAQPSRSVSKRLILARGRDSTDRTSRGL